MYTLYAYYTNYNRFFCFVFFVICSFIYIKFISAVSFEDNMKRSQDVKSMVDEVIFRAYRALIRCLQCLHTSQSLLLYVDIMTFRYKGLPTLNTSVSVSMTYV